MNRDPQQARASSDADPAAGPAPAPVWLFVLMPVLAFWGMGFLDKHGGGFDEQVYAPYNSQDEVSDDWPKSNEEEVSRLGRSVYEEKAKCVACHQPTGLGAAGQFPPLAGSDWVLAKDPSRIIRIVLDGLQGPVTVKGQQFSNVMVPWRDVLSDEEIAAVLTYVRGRKDWGNNASPVTPEQVKAIRDKTATHTGQWLEEELLKVPLSE